MNDEQIVELYLKRDESAIEESKAKYGAYCMKIAFNILNDELDSEECTNDTWLGAWRSIPPNIPSNLATYLGKITRNLSINRYKMKHAEKRSINEFAVSLDELGECVPGEMSPDDGKIGAVGESISNFLHKQKQLDRMVFVCRYFYCDSVSDIAKRFDVSESKVKSLLFRMRSKLKNHLANDGITV